MKAALCAKQQGIVGSHPRGMMGKRASNSLPPWFTSRSDGRVCVLGGAVELNHGSQTAGVFLSACSHLYAKPHISSSLVYVASLNVCVSDD